MRRAQQQGFTAVELLITLFVAAAFLIAAYQLFNVVVKDGGNARAESGAGNIAYDYLRRYTNSATNPCSPSVPVSGTPITVNGLTNAKITIAISCPSYTTTSLSQVEAIVSYGSPSVQTVKYSTYTNGSTSPASIRLRGWWRFNGNAIDGGDGHNNGAVSGATLTTGQTGEANTAYKFTANTDVITLPGNASSLYALYGDFFTFTAWVKYTTGGTILGSVTNGGPQFRIESGGALTLLKQSSVQLPSSSSTIPTGTWTLVAVTYTSGGVYTYYKNGVAIGTGTNLQTFNFNNYLIGKRNTTTESLVGSIDDLRIYNRILTASDLLAIYNTGAL